jgi:DNA processing protein
LVTEAAKRSGSLITARLAAEQGKDVFAVPGRIDMPFSQGTTFLIQRGARAVLQVGEILEQLI